MSTITRIDDKAYLLISNNRPREKGQKMPTIPKPTRFFVLPATPRTLPANNPKNELERLIQEQNELISQLHEEVSYLKNLAKSLCNGKEEVGK